MKKLLLLLTAGAALVAHADDLDKIREKGEVIIGVRDSSPPFGFFDKAKGTVSGYDIDFANYIARKLGVKPVFKTVDPADRIKALKEGRVNLIIASLAKSAEREKEVDFSVGYYVSTQKLVAKKGAFKGLLQLNQMTVCAPTGTTNARYLKDLSHTIKLVEPADYTEAFAAMRDGKCDGVSGPEATLMGNLAKMPDKQAYEIPDIPIASEALGVGIRKGEKRLQQQVNDALADAESTGEAVKIYDRWFGTGAAVQLPRSFKISR
ncbi:transporter substrate-binding domain-containing protein [Chitinimonas sp. BJB300]|uniref:transporter substrate-binding domain-containing protein n=1 Tax=Chitinimonas sp. BJB300 TaxID=1559339 RepID=UPI000C0EA76C|nr:transporter substrate-binding domain-containing protein [Chitinimonas sp. BJB300]PHV12436.1 amino acid ABC transporter substrate-binding protein [Chitinimonas sp. BJB300]TSJ88558.1 transporter substrate-binding domain-containing protein [Chitinimonas sp. BJB300]